MVTESKSEDKISFMGFARITKPNDIPELSRNKRKFMSKKSLSTAR